ncbi:hypothetical protein MAR_014999 [Mya arenaria]|uniref:RAI1-like domain-containing protein n=1 Tax=Mya arenaria TaxID=6604 RepID=A0ABY7FFS5_MYAAR|nr:hypothetical protein MAR_014999 [Mya arenaria]
MNYIITQIDFICDRSLLKRLLSTLFTKKEDWKFAVTLHNCTYYPCDYHTDQKLALKQQMMGGKYEELCAWGLQIQASEVIDTSCESASVQAPEVVDTKLEPDWFFTKKLISSKKI